MSQRCGTVAAAAQSCSGARRHRRATLYPWNLISVHFSEYFLKILIHACICIPDPQLPLDSAQICLTAPRYIDLLGSKCISLHISIPDQKLNLNIFWIIQKTPLKVRVTHHAFSNFGKNLNNYISWATILKGYKK